MIGATRLLLSPRSPSGSAGRRSVFPPVRTRLRRAVSLLLGVTVLCGVGTAVLLAELPSVGNAQRRVAAILRDHGGHVSRLAAGSRVARAIVATEDERFFDHGAVDLIAAGRALAHTLTFDRVDAGGSTITQQLARALYVPSSDSLGGRVEAIGLAFKLEQHYSKRQILGMYLDAVYYGHGFFGASQASEGYFSRPPNRLTWAKAALLVGLPQAPTAYDPLRHPVLARQRRHDVIHELVTNGALTPAAAKAADHAPLALRPG